MEEIQNYYEANIGLITYAVCTDIQFYLANGCTKQDIIFALTTAVNNRKKSWQYAKAIINNKLNDRKANEPVQIDYTLGGDPW